MNNVFGKIECPKCHQYKIQPAALVLLYFGIFLNLFVTYSKYLQIFIDEKLRIILLITGVISILIPLIQNLAHKTIYICKNCGKTYSYSELNILAKTQNVIIPDTTKRMFITFVAVFFTTMAIGAIFFLTSNGVKTTNKITQSIPKGNIHWDKAQLLFLQIKNEKDTEKIKTIDAEIVTELKLVLKEQPNNPRVWSELGDAYSWVSNLGGNLDDGLNAYKKAESLDPNNFVYINGVGDQLILMKKYNEAILQLQKAVRVGPNSYTFLSLGQAYRGAKIYDLAQQNYQKAVEGFSSHNTDGTFDAKILQAQQEMATLPK